MRSNYVTIWCAIPSKILFAISLILLACEYSFAQPKAVEIRNNTSQFQDQDYFGEAELKYEDRTYKENIRSAQINKTGFDLSEPVIELNSNESIILRFDDLDDQTKDFYFKLIHCTWDWRPTGMLESDFINGQWGDRLNDRDFSFNTMIPFIQYTLVLPNQNTRITRSGNYILMIYENNDPEDVVLTRRMMVYENEMDIKPRIRDARASSDRRFKQEVTLNVDQREMRVNDPFGKLKVVLLQNMRWDDMRVPQPQFLNGNEMVYSDSKELIFNGGNEWRNFDIKTLRFNTERVKNIELGTSSTTVTLLPDKDRSIAVYRSDPDINGRFIIRNEDGYNDHLEADYVNLRFTLECYQPFSSGNVHVYGDLSERRLSEENKMVYSEKLGVYFYQTLIKQGFYDYQYVFMADSAEVGNPGFLEGDHSETDNDYVAFIYFHEMSGNYDRLVGVRFFNSMRDRF